jgi:hypothetical protein
MKTTMVDPPKGWAYGFPKALPNPLPQPWSLTLWLISEGYPGHELAKFGNFFEYVRTWEVDDDDPNDIDKVARRGYD